MRTNPNGTVASAIKRTQYLVARCDSFRTWAGVTGVDEAAKLVAALARIHRLIHPDPAVADFPLAVVSYGSFTGQRYGEGGGQFLKQKTVAVEFWQVYAEAPTADDLETLYETCEAIGDDMTALSGTGGHIRFESYRRGDIEVLAHEYNAAGGTPARRDLVKIPYFWTGPNWGRQTETT